MPVPLAEIVKRVPFDCAERVERTRAKFNAAVREALRRESALRLNPNDGLGEVEAISVSVRTRPGLPVALKDVQLEDAEAVALILSRWRSPLEALRSGAAGCRAMTSEVSADSRLTEMVEGAEGLLAPVEAWAERLLREMAAARPLARILIEQDVLGTYAYGSVPLVEWMPDPPENPRIELYWAVIGLVAGTLGVTVEDMTVVVLAHELGHAYSHLGADIDGQRWPTAAFRRAETDLVEGVAQYYTHHVCLRLRDQCPRAIDAYKTLLEHQPKPYHAHEPWVKQARPEEVRFAMIEARRRSLDRIELFNGLVHEAGQRWRGRSE